MRPPALAALHALCFTTPRPWREDEFENLLKTPGIFLVSHENGFALGRIAGPEAELLTIAIHPDMQHIGHGRRLLDDFIHHAAARGAKEVFLEVAETNHAAITLYKNAGFMQVAERKAYFRQVSGPALNAYIFKHLI